MKNISKLKFLAVLTMVAMTALLLPLQIAAQAPPPRPGQTQPAPPPRPGTPPAQPAQPVVQWATNLPANVDVMIQTAVAPSNSTAGFWDLPGASGWRNGAKFQLWDMGGAENTMADRRFRFEHQGDGWYIIRSNAHGVVDVPEGGVAVNGTQLTVYDRHGRNNQRFRFRHVSNGEYVIQTAAGKYLHVGGGNNSNNGSGVVIWDGDSPTWRLYVQDGLNIRQWRP